MSSIDAQDLTDLEADPRLFLYTSLTAGSSHIFTATSRLETILKANKIPFVAIDIATHEKARRLWGRRAGKRKLPGLVKEGFVVGDINEVEEWNEYGELKEVIGPVPSAAPAAPTGASSTKTEPASAKEAIKQPAAEAIATATAAAGAIKIGDKSDAVAASANNKEQPDLGSLGVLPEPDRDPSAHASSVTLPRSDGLPVKVDPAQLSSSTTNSLPSTSVPPPQTPKADILADPKPETSHSSADTKQASIHFATTASESTPPAAAPPAADTRKPSEPTPSSPGGPSSPVAVTDIPIEEVSRRELSTPSLPLSSPAPSTPTTVQRASSSHLPGSVAAQSETAVQSTDSFPAPAASGTALPSSSSSASLFASGVGETAGTSHHRGSEVRHASDAEIKAAEASRRIDEEGEESAEARPVEAKNHEAVTTGQASAAERGAVKEQVRTKGEDTEAAEGEQAGPPVVSSVEARETKVTLDESVKRGADADAAGVSVED